MKEFLKYTCLSISIGFILPQIIYGQKVATYEDPLKTYKDGMHLYHNGIYAAAQDQFDALLSTYQLPYSYTYRQHLMEAEFYKASSGLKLGRNGSEKELITFVKNHKPDPFAAKAVIEIAEFNFRNKNYEEALKYYDELEIHNLDPLTKNNVRFHIGYSEFVLKKFSQARIQFELIKEEETEYYYPANYYYAMCNYFLESYDDALSGFRKVAQSRQYENSVPYYITQIYYVQQQYDEVIAFATDLLDKPNLEYKDNIQFLLGQAYFKKGNYEKARPYLQVNAENKNLSIDDKYQLGFAFYKSKKYNDAVSIFRDISGVDSKLGQNANFYLADTYLHLSQKNDARVAFAAASRMDYDKKLKEEALFNYGKLSAELNHHREAINTLKEMPKSSSFYTESQKILSDVFLNTIDYSGSIETIEQMDYKSDIVRKAYQKITLYRALQRLNDKNPNGALTDLNTSLAIDIDPYYEKKALYWKAKILHDKGEYQESINLLKLYFDNSDAASISPIEIEGDVNARYLQGYNHFKLKDYQFAEGYFSKVINSLKNANNPGLSEVFKEQILSDAYLRLADAQFKRNEYDISYQNYNAAKNINSSISAYAMYQQAIMRGLQGNNIEKITILNSLIESEPSSGFTDDALLLLGKTYMAEERYDKAIEPFKTLLNKFEKTSPLIVDGYLNLGLIAYNQGDVQSALKYYKKIFDYNPSKDMSDNAMTAIQEIYINDLSDPSGFVTFMEDTRGTALRNSSKDSLTYRAAEISYETGNYEKAVANFTSYLTEFPKGSQRLKAHYARAESNLILKKYSDALLDYEYVATKGPSAYYIPALKKAAILAYNNVEDFDKAARYYAIIEKHVSSPKEILDAQLGGLRAAFRMENREQIISLANKVSTHPRASESEIALTQYYLGKTAYRLKHYDESLRAFNQVIMHSQSEQAAESRYLISKIYFDRQEYDLAEQLADKAYRENSNYPLWVAKSLILLSDILVEKGDLLKARAALKAILENFTANEEITQLAKKKLTLIKEKQEKLNPTDGKYLEMDESSN